mgnify:CR=1 FL=1
MTDRLLKYVTVSMVLLAAVVSWIATPLSFLLVKLENRRYNEVNSC